MIYYVEDDINIRELALYALRQSGLDAKGFDRGEPFREACLKHVPDLILLDIMLPGEDGISLVGWVRQNKQLSCVPVMVLSAKGTEFDKVCGLDAGADDYMTKPYGMMELVSRSKALIRRSQRKALSSSKKDAVLKVGHIVLSETEHEVRVGNAKLDLTIKEFDLLKKLMKSPGQAFTRRQLLEDVWDVDYFGETRTVDTHVLTLRHKLNALEPQSGELIETVRGVGYRIRKEA